MNTKFENLISIDQILDYEIRSHWLSPWIWFKWGQVIMGRYFARRIKTKYKRYKKSREFQIKYYGLQK